MLHADVGNNHLLAEVFDKLVYLKHDKTPNPTDDDWNIATQAKAMRDLVNEPEVARFAEIAYSSADVRRMVGAGKLAIVLGIEVEDFGHFTTKLKGKNEVEARKLIREYLAMIHDLGIRHVFPIHLTNNAFGGTAVYSIAFLAANLLDRGAMIEMRHGFANGIRLRLDHALPLFKELDDLTKLRGLERFRTLLQASLKLRERPLGHAINSGSRRMARSCSRS